MIALAILAAMAAPAFSNEEAYAAIWGDAALNAMIGNWNEAVSWDWYYGHDDKHGPALKIANLDCQARRRERVCSFDFERTPDPQTTSPKDASEPRRLACTMILHVALDDEGKTLQWRVMHLPPPPEGGHSRTTMQCVPVKDEAKG